MARRPESNPYFLPHDHDPVMDFPRQAPPPRPRLPPPRHQGRMSTEPPYGPTPQAPTQHPQSHPKPLPPSEPESQVPRRGHRPSYLHQPTSRPTSSIAWLVAAFCALFWVIVIVGGLIILIVYLLFRPRNPRFDISTATINAAYLDMGYLLNADITVLANFTNPNTKVNVDFNYIVLDLYYGKNFIATRYIEPFSVMKRESRFADVHMVSSQVRLSLGNSVELQRQINNGRVNFEIKGFFRTRSRLGGIFQYSYWLYAHCQIEVTGPPTGVLIGKKCVTKR